MKKKKSADSLADKIEKFLSVAVDKSAEEDSNYVSITQLNKSHQTYINK